MRKLPLTAALLVAFAVSLAAQEAPGASASTDVSLLNIGNLENYSKSFLNGNGSSIASKYIRVASDEDFEKIAPIGGNATRVDTPLEIALLSTCAGVIDIRPIEAQNMLPANPRTAGLKLGSAVLKELAELKFLDPSNTAAIGRYEGMIKFISDKNGVSRADIEKYLKDGIAAEVDKHFNTAYGDFIPAVVYDEYKRTNPVDALALIRNAITDFFLDPNRNIYAVLTGIHARYWMNGGLNRHSFGYSARESFYITLDALSPALAKRVSDDVSQNATALARIPNDPQYNIFSNPPGMGGGE